VLGPIFAREFLTVPRRASHYTARAASLGLLWVVGVTAWLATNAFGRAPTLGESARFGLLVFQVFTFVQLTLVLFSAPLSAATAVAREKDRRTFVLLLMTDLRDYEIVLGKLLGSLLPILLVLLGSLPVLGMLLLLGGIAPFQVVQSWLILGATAFAAGSLGGLIALWRDRTFQALALSLLSLVLYFALTGVLGLVGPYVSASADWSAVQSWTNPYLALVSVLDPQYSGELATPPVYGFLILMVVWSVLLNAAGLWKLRVWNPGGEPVMQRETPEDEAAEEAKERAKAHAAPGAIRAVWPNPILWREIRTRAYGHRPLLIKFAYFLVLGLICYAAFAGIQSGTRLPFQAALGLLPVAILSLLLVAAQAVTAITSERDGGALDLLLVTDLSPQEFIFGKLGGIAYNTKEYLLPPLILACVYAGLGMLATPPRNQPQLAAGMNVQSLLAVLGALVVLLAFTLVLGVFVALRIVNSRQAILNTLGTVFFLSVGTMVCIYLILINGGTFEYQFLSFSLFLIAGIGGLMWVLSADQPTQALTLASILLPICMFYCVTNVLVANPGSTASADPLVPFLALVVPFGVTIAAMLVPLLGEFDVALGRTRLEE
jgi:ABC-type transport system involved in multi-copper enzyme maturation permease subunit